MLPQVPTQASVRCIRNVGHCGHYGHLIMELVYKREPSPHPGTLNPPKMSFSLSTNVSSQRQYDITRFRHLRSEFLRTAGVHEELDAYGARDNKYTYQILCNSTLLIRNM